MQGFSASMVQVGLCGAGSSGGAGDCGEWLETAQALWNLVDHVGNWGGGDFQHVAGQLSLCPAVEGHLWCCSSYPLGGPGESVLVEQGGAWDAARHASRLRAAFYK